MESVELTFPMDSPDKEDNSPKEDTNQYIPWQPPTHRKKSDPSKRQTTDNNLKCKEDHRLNNNVSQAESEYCLWEPDTDSASRRRRGRKESSKTPSDTDLRWSANSSISEEDSKLKPGCVKTSPESSFRLWPDTRFSFRRRATTISAAESYTRRRREKVSPVGDRVRTTAVSKSIGDGGEYLSPGGISCKRFSPDYCSYDLSSSAPSAPGSIIARSSSHFHNNPPTNLRRYTVSKTYFPSRSSSSFSFRSGTGKSLTNIKSSLSYSERNRTGEPGPMSPPPELERDEEQEQTSWKECPLVIQTVADSKQKGLPIIPMPLWGVGTMPQQHVKHQDTKQKEKVQTPQFEKSGNEFRKKYSECSDRASYRNISECSTSSFAASESSCTFMAGCLCPRCSSTTSVENSLYILYDHTPSDESDQFSFERTKSDTSSMHRPSILKTSPEKNILNHRRETVSESSSGFSSQPSTSSSGQIRSPGPEKSQPCKHLPPLNDTFNIPQSENSYMLMDGHVNDVNISQPPKAAENSNEYMVMVPTNQAESKVLSNNSQTPRAAENCTEYMIMEPANKSDARANINSQPLTMAENYNQFIVMETANRIDAKVTYINSKPLSAAKDTNEYMIMEPTNKNDATVKNIISQPLSTAENCNEYMTMEPVNKTDAKCISISSQPPATAENSNEYMIMEPTNKNIHIIPKTEEFNVTQGDQYLIMDLGKSHESNPCNDYLLMTLTSSADNNYMDMSQSGAVTSYPSTSSADILSSITPCVLVASLPSINEPLVALVTSTSEEMLAPQPRIHSSVSQPSLANLSASNTSLTSAGSGQPILKSGLSHGKSVPGDINEYMTMDPPEKEQPKFSSYMTMSSSNKAPSKEHWKLDNNVNTTNSPDNEYILIYNPEGSQIPTTTIHSSPSQESVTLDPCKDPTAPQTSTTTSSTYSRTFGAFKLPFTKQLIIPKPGSSNSKSAAGATSPTSPEPTSPRSPNDSKRLSPPVTTGTTSLTHRNSMSSKLSPITRRLSAIKLKPKADRQISTTSAGTPTVELDTSGCYLVMGGGVIQDVTVLQDVLKDPRIGGAYAPVNGSASGVVRKVSFCNQPQTSSQEQSSSSSGNGAAKTNYMSYGTSAASSTTANLLRSKSLTDDQVQVLQGKLKYFLNVAQENREYRRHKKGNKNKEDYVMVNYPTSKPQNINKKQDPKLYLSLSN